MCTTAKGDCVHLVVDGRIVIKALGPTEVAVAGEIDAATAPRLRAELVDSRVSTVECSGVTYFSGAGLRALLDAASRQPDGRLRLSSPSIAVCRLIEVCEQTAAFLIER